MITFETPQGRFKYRVAGVAIVDGHVLLHRATEGSTELTFKWFSLDRLHPERIEPAFLREALPPSAVGHAPYSARSSAAKASLKTRLYEPGNLNAISSPL